jgi:hypothetical protein
MVQYATGAENMFQKTVGRCEEAEGEGDNEPDGIQSHGRLLGRYFVCGPPSVEGLRRGVNHAVEETLWGMLREVRQQYPVDF